MIFRARLLVVARWLLHMQLRVHIAEREGMEQGEGKELHQQSRSILGDTGKARLVSPRPGPQRRAHPAGMRLCGGTGEEVGRDSRLPVPTSVPSVSCTWLLMDRPRLQ